MSLPEGEDPCDFFMKRGAGPFLELKDEAKEIFDFKVTSPLASTTSRRSRDRQEHWTRYWRQSAKVPTLRSPGTVSRKAYGPARPGREDRHPGGALRERMKGLRTGRAEAPTVKREMKLPSEEKWLLETVLAEPKLVEAAAARVSPEDLRSAELSKILRAVYEANERLGEAKLSSVVTAVGELGALAVSLAENGARQENHEQRLADCIARIERAQEARDARAAQEEPH